MNISFDGLKRFLLPIIIFFLCILSVHSQTYRIYGLVIDSLSKEPLPFVNIVLNNGTEGGISDLDGKFSIYSTTKPEKITISYVGYETKALDIQAQQEIFIEMKPSAFQLNEFIVLPGINPAHRIIDSAIVYRDVNNPLKLNSFSYVSYNRFVVTPDMEYIRQKAAELNDTSWTAYLEFFEKHFLFLMESVSERKFLQPDFSEEKVIASRVAGFSDPLFTLLMSQMQSFSFYDDLITISDKEYVNPVSAGSSSKYLFLLEDTLYDNRDSIFVISYRPLKGKNFDGLEGLLYIHTDRWAIQNVTAAPAQDETGFGIRIQQQYARSGTAASWFPSQLNTDLLFKNVSLNKLELYGQGRTYISEIEINPPLKKRDFSDAQIVYDERDSESQNLIKDYKKDYGSIKDSVTYLYLDSIGKENNFDRILGMMKIAMSAEVPVWIFNIPILDVVNFNDFEGWRTGLGIETNERLFDGFSLGIRGAYGFLDKKYKYGGFLKYVNTDFRDLTVKAVYSYDVSESGGKQFFDSQNSLIDPGSYRTFLVDLMDYYEEYLVQISGRAFRNSMLFASVSDIRFISGDDYSFGSEGENVFIGSDLFHAFRVSAGFHYDPNVKMIRGLDYQIGLVSQTPKPQLKIEYQRGIEMPDATAYNAIDVWMRKKFYTKYFGTTDVVLQAGFIDRPVPYPFMRVIPAAFRKFGIYVPSSFLTVRMNEFVSDRYLYGFFRHDFGKLLFRTKFFAPSLTLALNGAIGSVREPQRHRNRIVEAPVEGIYEGGLIIDNILRVNLYSFGIATFYRFGHYALPEMSDNLSFTLSFRVAM